VDKKNPDNDILVLLRSDVNKRFRLVVERYSSKLYWHIRRLVILHEDADDALQNTFINAWRNIGDFRSESSIYTWLYAIATNEALALINKGPEMRHYSSTILQAISLIPWKEVHGSTGMKHNQNSRTQYCNFLRNSVLFLISSTSKKCRMRR
jgi:RNA polymerase sigma factor (sigma-70 family)